VRPEILTLTPYRSARNEYEGTGNISLDANENPDKPYGQATTGLNRYPEPQPKVLRQTLADMYGVRPEQLLMTRGMDEGIDLLVRTFCVPYKDSITIITPTFGYYEVSANIQGAAVIKVSRLKDIQEDTKIIFICTPNNPTGEVTSLENIQELCERYAGRALVAVDEAYIEFANTEAAGSAVVLLNKYDNLVVMRTLSKAYGMAGVRLGTVMASPEIINFLRTVMPPYPIPTPCVQRALESLSPLGLLYTQRRIAQIKQDRQYLYEQLPRSKEIVRVFPSAGNFLLVIAQDADALYTKLKSTGIVVRKRTHDVENSLRITVGTPAENQLLLEALGLIEPPQNAVRTARQVRKTNETEIVCEVSQNHQGKYQIQTGIAFFDHMLEQLSRHSGISLCIQAIGDTHIDAHHTVEDVAITLGMALRDALGDKRGMNRYGFVLPMDEALAQVSIDLSGRGACQFQAVFPSPTVGSFPCEMVKHFFDTLSDHMGAAIHISVSGENTHHMIEGIFKGFARALQQAVDVRGSELPSTKGVL
jgi:histidinol-phosphate aminotransferase/imidazoleglycerol-phosphate dehydratase/histidinol-phosphatase